MDKLKYLVILAVLAIISGCSSNQYAVTIDSNPKGAEVFCNGQSYGYAPVTRYFKLDEATKNSGYLRTCQWGLRWVSGATARVNNVYNLNEFPNGVIWTTPRPNVAGYAQDAEFSLKVQTMKAQQEQANKVKVRQAWASLNTDLKNLNRTLGSTPAVTPTPSSNYNLNALPAPAGYESTYVPTGTVGVLKNSSITNGYKLCEYNNGRATRLPMGQQCPTVLK